MRFSVSQRTLSKVYCLKTSKFCITKLNRICVAKSKLSLTIATKSCKMASHGRIEAVFTGAFGEFPRFIYKCSVFWFGPARMPKIIPLIIFLCMSSDYETIRCNKLTLSLYMEASAEYFVSSFQFCHKS